MDLAVLDLADDADPGVDLAAVAAGGFHREVVAQHVLLCVVVGYGLVEAAGVGDAVLGPADGRALGGSALAYLVGSGVST